MKISNLICEFAVFMSQKNHFELNKINPIFRTMNNLINYLLDFLFVGNGVVGEVLSRIFFYYDDGVCTLFMNNPSNKKLKKYSAIFQHFPFLRKVFWKIK
jgi:hypothetical protein